MKVSPFLTNSGIAFQFQTNNSNLVYVTTDYNSLVKDVFKDSYDHELYIGREIVFDEKKYKINHFGGYTKTDPGCDYDREQITGIIYGYTFILLITIEEII